MFFRKYLAFVETIFPWVFCCVISWWVDRLFVEFGHRTTDSPTCTHSDLQYVHWHQFVTATAVFAQTVYSVSNRRKQFKRELTLVGVISYKPCLIHLYALQSLLCVSWSIVIACLIDVSPWLCLESVLEYRASISASALLSVLFCLIMERKCWSWTLNKAVTMDSNTLVI